MQQSQLLDHCGSSKVTREELKVIPTPPASQTHQPLPHYEIVGALAETLSFRQISVVREEYAVSGDGMKMFGVLDLETTFDGCRFSIGVRNSNDKTMRLALTVGYRVLVCDNMAFHGDFTPVLAKHTKHLSLVDILAIGVDRMQRNFEPMRRQVEAWRTSQPSDEATKLISYRAFIEGELEIPYPGTWPASCTITTSILSIRSSRRGRCGACRTHSPRPSRNWKSFRSSEQRRTWERFLKVFRQREHAAKPTSAGGKCERQTYLPPDSSASTRLRTTSASCRTRRNG